MHQWCRGGLESCISRGGKSNRTLIVSSVPSISKDVSGLGDSWQAWQRVWIRENMQMYAFYCLAIAPLCVSYNTLCRVGNYFNSIHSCAKLVVKLIYSEKATKVCEVSTLLLSYVVPIKSKVEISQNFVARIYKLYQ